MTVAVIANDNVELACAFIQKKAIEKAIQEIDKRLKNEYEQRIVARKEGRRYCDPVVLTYQTEQMPEPIKLKLGGVTNQQSAVYNEFARNVPGFKPLTDRELHSILPKATPQIGSGDTGGSGSGPGGPGQQQQPSSTNRYFHEIFIKKDTKFTNFSVTLFHSNEQLVTSVECIAILEEVLSKVEPFVSNCTALPDNPHMANLR